MSTRVSPSRIPTRVDKRTRLINLVAVVVPFAAVLVAVPLTWGSLVGSIDLLLLAIFYLLTCVGITVGYHRLLSHGSFETHRWLRRVLVVLGCMAFEGPPINWVADHRQHHRFADREGDPHSPHMHATEGLRGVARGLWHAHLGWLLKAQSPSETVKYAPDLVRDPFMRALSRVYLGVVALGLLIPALIGGLVTNSWSGALSAFLWAGLVRIFFIHHATWSVNSVGHYFGRRRYDTPDHSTNVFWLALPSLGDSWHHNHHAFPTSARHGMRWWEIDISGALITALERLGLVWNVVRIRESRRRSKLSSVSRTP